MYTHVYIHMYVFVYIYIYTHTHTHTHSEYGVAEVTSKISKVCAFLSIFENVLKTVVRFTFSAYFTEGWK